jgi:hypothetical protein
MPIDALELGCIHFEAFSIRTLPPGTLLEGVEVRVSRPKDAAQQSLLGKRAGARRQGNMGSNIVLRLGLQGHRVGGEWGRVPSWVSAIVAPLVDRGWVTLAATVASETYLVGHLVTFSIIIFPTQRCVRRALLQRLRLAGLLSPRARALG